MAVVDVGAVRGPRSALQAMLASPLYRGATIALFICGVGVSAAAPQIVLFLVNDLHASLVTAGLFYLTNLTAPLAGYLVGSLSDRTGRRLNLFRLCAVAGALGWAGIAISTQVWMPFVISAVILGFSGAAMSQLFAAVHDNLNGDPDGEGVIAIVRMALTAGWVIGPVFGAFLAATVGYRPMLLVVAGCLLLQLVPLGLMRDTASPVVVAETADLGLEAIPRRDRVKAMLPLLAFVGLFILFYTGEPIKYGYLPVYMKDVLQVPAAISGAVIGIQPFIELLLMPLAVVVGRRVGLMRLMALGAAFGVGANVCFAFSGHVVGMFAGQILMGGAWGVFAALGIIMSQRLLPQAVATASAIFMSSNAVGNAWGGLVGALGMNFIGLPLVYVLPATCGLIAACGLLLMSRKHDS